MSSSDSTATSLPLDRERDRPHLLQIELYRRATPTQKLATVAQLNATALKLKESDLDRRFSDLTASQRRELLRRWWLGSRD